MRDSLLLTTAALAAFSLSLTGSFHFDDYTLFSDPNVTAWTATRPLTNATFRLNELLGGRNPTGYHAVNLVVHVGAVLLLRRALAMILAPRLALVAALVFAVHPAQSEPVNYVFARGTLLAALFSIAALHAWLRGAHWAAVGWFAAGLLSKEECVAVPLFLVILDLSRTRRISRIAPLAAMLALSAAAGLRAIWATANVPGAGSGITAAVTPFEYLSTQGVAILRYLWLLIVPWGFTIDVQLPIAPPWIRALAWLAVAAAAGVALRYFRNVTPGIWFIGGLLLLLPSSSIFPADDFAADRRLYLPMIAFAPLIAWAIDRVDRRAVYIAVAAYVLISVRYSYVWQTEERLWTEAAARSPRKARPLLQLARLQAPSDALDTLARAQRIAPDDAAVPAEQGRAYLSLGRPADALAAFGRALAILPGDAAALSNRGVALAMLGQTAAARDDFERALKANPCLFDARLNLKRLGTTAARDPRCRYTPEQRAQLDW